MPPPFSGADQLAPVSPDFGANPALDFGQSGWQFQMPLEGMGGMAGVGAAEPGNDPLFGNG